MLQCRLSRVPDGREEDGKITSQTVHSNKSRVRSGKMVGVLGSQWRGRQFKSLSGQTIDEYTDRELSVGTQDGERQN